MRVLVTGGAGFVGSHVVDRLLAEGHTVAVVDNLSTGRADQVNRAATLHVCDIRSPRLADAFEAARPEALVHLAAQPTVSRSLADPLLDASVNVLGTIAVLEGCRRHAVGRVVYVSTGGAAYGDTAVLPTPEDHPTHPVSPYGASKLAGEAYLGCWAALAGGSGLALRLANVYGPRQSPEGEAGVVAIFSHRLVRGETCVVNGDGEQTRDYVYVEDVAEAVARALGHPAVAGVLNVGTGTATSVNELYRRLAQVADVARPPRHGPARPGEQRRSVLEARRARERLGWVATTTLDEGLRATVEWFRKNASATAEGPAGGPKGGA